MASMIASGHLFALPVFVVAFLILLSIIVFSHEYGHFRMARLLGVRVDVFSIGFGKPLARWVDRKGTEWRIAAIPLGGYVKFFGDANAASQPAAGVVEEQSKDSPWTTQFPRPGESAAGSMTPEERRSCFHFKPVWVRAAVVAAGPFANFLLAIAIFWVFLFSFGEIVVKPIVGAVDPDSAAAEAGFMPGDRIISIDGRPVRDFDDLGVAVKLSSGERLTFIVERDGANIALQATPRREQMKDSFGNTVEAGRLGITADPKAQAQVRYGPVAALRESCERTVGVLGATVKFLGRLIIGKENTSELGGPVKMAKYAGQAAMSGFDKSAYAEPPGLWTKLKVSLAGFANLAAVVSISMGFMNLLPIPVLDGGHLMYYAYEAVARRPLGAKAQAIGFGMGIVLLASLMLFVTWNDISNLLSQTS
ncbi:MAG: PDZ domain-containing protein [Alphaproteobacteria bacterium]|nr:PDZ domain-containing protein [Alphaproteobacteria bacterium]